MREVKAEYFMVRPFFSFLSFLHTNSPQLCSVPGAAGMDSSGEVHLVEHDESFKRAFQFFKRE